MAARLESGVLFMVASENCVLLTRSSLARARARATLRAAYGLLSLRRSHPGGRALKGMNARNRNSISRFLSFFLFFVLPFPCLSSLPFSLKTGRGLVDYE